MKGGSVPTVLGTRHVGGAEAGGAVFQGSALLINQSTSTSEHRQPTVILASTVMGMILDRRMSQTIPMRRETCATTARTERLREELPLHPDVLFRLAALKQARSEATDGPAAQAARAEVQQLIQRVLEDDQYERRDEARRFLEP